MTITPTGGYDGRLTWSFAVTGTSTMNITGCYEIDPITISGATTTPLTIGTGAACSAVTAAATANAKGVFRIVGRRAVAMGDRPTIPGHAPVTFVYASLLFGGCLAWRRRKGGCSWLILILVLPIAGASFGGCGGGSSSSSPPTPPPTPPSTTLTATLTGTDSVNGLVTATATFTLTVDGQ